jgi:tetratricopeptide (TPR) repeat protein
VAGLARVVGPALALAWFYLGLFVARPPAPAGPGVLAARDTAALVAEARAHLRGKRPAQALPLLERLHQQAPTNHIYSADLAETYRALSRFADEARAWDDYVASAPLAQEACPAWPRAWEHAGDPRRSLAAYRRCHELDPSDPDGIFFLALALEHQQQPDQARALYAEGVRLSPAYDDMAIGLARLDLRAGKVAEARRRSEAVLGHAPDTVDALLVAGMAALRDGDLVNARSRLSRGLELAPAYADFHLGLGAVAERRGKTAEAIAHYAKAVAANPGDGEAALALARARKGTVMRASLVIALRWLFVGFCLLSAAFCVLALIPFTWVQVIQFNLLSGQRLFLEHQHHLYWLAATAGAASLVGDRRSLRSALYACRSPRGAGGGPADRPGALAPARGRRHPVGLGGPVRGGAARSGGRGLRQRARPVDLGAGLRQRRSPAPDGGPGWRPVRVGAARGGDLRPRRRAGRGTLRRRRGLQPGAAPAPLPGLVRAAAAHPRPGPAVRAPARLWSSWWAWWWWRSAAGGGGHRPVWRWGRRPSPGRRRWLVSVAFAAVGVLTTVGLGLRIHPRGVPVEGGFALALAPLACRGGWGGRRPVALRCWRRRAPRAVLSANRMDWNYLCRRWRCWRSG